VTCPFLCVAVPSPLPVALLRSCKHLKLTIGDAVLICVMQPEHVKSSNAQGSSALACDRQEVTVHQSRMLDCIRKFLRSGTSVHEGVI